MHRKGRKNREQVTHFTRIVGKKTFVGKCKEDGGLTFQDIEMQMREHQQALVDRGLSYWAWSPEWPDKVTELGGTAGSTKRL